MGNPLFCPPRASAVATAMCTSQITIALWGKYTISPTKDKLFLDCENVVYLQYEI